MSDSDSQWVGLKATALFAILVICNYFVICPPWDLYFSTLMYSIGLFAAIAPVVHGIALFIVVNPNSKGRIVATTLWAIVVYVIVAIVNLCVLSNISVNV